jgi:hypothetical protein
MALIEIYTLVTDQLPVDNASAAEIIEGQCVSLNADGTARHSLNGEVVYGIAADTKSNTQTGTPYHADLVMGADGNLARSSQNRVSDAFNETGASGLISVFTGAGSKFATDQFEPTRVDNLTPGTVVYSSDNGLLTDQDASALGFVVGVVAAAPAAYPSGVPGIDAPDNNMTLGTYVTFKLLV